MQNTYQEPDDIATIAAMIKQEHDSFSNSFQLFDHPYSNQNHLFSFSNGEYTPRPRARLRLILRSSEGDITCLTRCYMLHKDIMFNITPVCHFMMLQCTNRYNIITYLYNTMACLCCLITSSQGDLLFLAKHNSLP